MENKQKFSFKISDELSNHPDFDEQVRKLIYENMPDGKHMVDFVIGYDGGDEFTLPDFLRGMKTVLVTIE